jgi:hypothetical protein
MTASEQETKAAEDVAIPAQRRPDDKQAAPDSGAPSQEAAPSQEVAPAQEAAPAPAAAPSQEIAPSGAAAPSQELTRADAKKSEPVTGSVAAAPDDARQLELEIERTREQLGETVQELLARVDVKARARSMATEMSGKWKSRIGQARNQAAIRAGGMRDQVAGNTVAARQKAVSAGRAGRDQVRGRMVAAGTPAWEAMPEQVRGAVTKGANGARERWIPLAVTAGVIIIGCLAIRQWKVRPSSADSSDC